MQQHSELGSKWSVNGIINSSVISRMKVDIKCLGFEKKIKIKLLLLIKLVEMTGLKKKFIIIINNQHNSS